MNKSCKSSVKARRVLSQAPRIDNNQQAKKKPNNAVGHAKRKETKKRVMKKASRGEKMQATLIRGLLSILNEPRVALRDFAVGSC